jgi:hypothetical protein
MELLQQLYSIHSPSGEEKKMKKFIRRWVKNNVPDAVIENDNAGNVYVTKGIADTYPCVVSHVDQVQHNHSKDFQVCWIDDDILFGYSYSNKRFEGLGADDKNGIWVCLKCLQKYDVMKCAFFVQEEHGCVGSSSANFEWFNDCRFVLQCDRKNGSDLITNSAGTELCSQEFLDCINYQAYGYVPTNGSITDVMALKEGGVGVCMLNISCGYYNAHSDEEVTCVIELENCRNFVMNIIENCTDVYPHKYVDKWSNYRGSTYGGWHGYYDLCDLGENTPTVGELLKDDFPNLRDKEQMYQSEFDDTMDSIWHMVQCNPEITADEIWNSYHSSFSTLTLADIEYMVELAKEDLG